MGQSMDSPSKPSKKTAASRYSSRSLQRSSKKSLFHDKKDSHSISKMQQIRSKNKE
jgi:hypothetical protein